MGALGARLDSSEYGLAYVGVEVEGGCRRSRAHGLAVLGPGKRLLKVRLGCTTLVVVVVAFCLASGSAGGLDRGTVDGVVDVLSLGGRACHEG